LGKFRAPLTRIQCGERVDEDDLAIKPCEMIAEKGSDDMGLIPTARELDSLGIPNQPQM
jgi:hypothetical protein